MEFLMNFLKKLFGLSPQPQRNDFIFTVKCKRCGEEIHGRIDLTNDLSVEYEGDNEFYYSRKVLMGENRCFQRIEVQFKFSSDRQLMEQEIIGGEFVS
jgi:hypothetical protein